MKEFPLNPFFQSLEDIPFQVTLGDYRRITLVLKTEGQWSITQLRDLLYSLLVKDDEGGELFLRRFNAFFYIPLEDEKIYNTIEVEKAFTDLIEQANKPHEKLQHEIKHYQPERENVDQ